MQESTELGGPCTYLAATPFVAAASAALNLRVGCAVYLWHTRPGCAALLLLLLPLV